MKPYKAFVGNPLEVDRNCLIPKKARKIYDEPSIMYKDFDLTIDHVTKILIPKYKVAALPCLIIYDMIMVL